MPETVERGERARRAYISRRFAKSRKLDGLPWDDVVIAAISGGIALWLAPEADAFKKFAIAAAAGLSGVLVWHFIIHPAYRFIWTVPIEEHVAQQFKIHDLEDQVRESQVARALANQTILDELSALHVEGVEIKERILGNRAWDNALKPIAKDWNLRVRGIPNTEHGASSWALRG